MTYVLLLNCALKLVEEIIPYVILLAVDPHRPLLTAVRPFPFSSSLALNNCFCLILGYFIKPFSGNFVRYLLETHN